MLTGRNAIKGFGGQLAELVEKGAKSSADDGQGDVVDGGAVLGADALQAFEGVDLRGEPAIATDVFVQDRMRGLEGVGDITVFVVAADLSVVQRFSDIE